MPTTKVVRTTVVRSSTSTTSHFSQIWLWAVLVACLALLFAIISVATPGWRGRNLLKNCPSCLGTVILAFLGILCLILGIISTVLFAKRLITSFSIGIKVSSVLLFALAAIFFVTAYVSIDRHDPFNYSYYLMVTAGVFTFVASIIIAFWLGRNWSTV